MNGLVSADSYYEEEMPSSVEGYRRYRITVSDRGDFPEEPSRGPNKVPLCIVHDGPRRFRPYKWIEALTFKSDDIYIAQNETLRLFGDGPSEHEAIEDLSRQIVYFYEFYQALDPQQATQDALDLKQLYQGLLVELG